MAITKATSDEVSSKIQKGVPPSITITANTFTNWFAITLPTTPVPHNYLIVGSIEYANGNGGTANEFAVRIMNGATQEFILYHDCHAGTYFTSSSFMHIQSSSGGVLNVHAYSQAASRGTTNRGEWMAIDLGVA